MPWAWAAFMPHPPIIISEVGRGREKEAAKTLAGLGEMLKKLTQLPDCGRPDVLLILSPHQTYAPERILLNSAAEVRGHLGRFGAPGIAFDLKISARLKEFGQHLAEFGLPVAMAETANLSDDHGSMVPLCFLGRAFSPMPEVAIANPVGLSPAQALLLGRALAAWNCGEENWALLASGDLSHRLNHNSPSGFSPHGLNFDHDVVEALKNGTPARLISNWPPKRLEAAGECGYRSALAMMGLTNESAEILSYEAPFGVGYGLAWWRNSNLEKR